MFSLADSGIRNRLSDDRLIAETFYRMLPYQVLMIAIAAVNGIVDSLYASNAIGEAAMSAMGLFAPIGHVVYAAGVLLGGGKAFVHVPRTHGHGIARADMLIYGPRHQRFPGDGEMGLKDVAPLEGDPRRVVAYPIGAGRKIRLHRLDVLTAHR